MSFEVISPKELGQYQGRKDVIFVDLREKEEYLEYHLEGAVNLPYEELPKQSHFLSRYPVIILYCDRGNVSLLAARDLKDWKNRVITVSGGMHQIRKLH